MKKKGPCQVAHNPFRPGNFARRKPDYINSGGWRWGHKVFTVRCTEYGHLLFKEPEVDGGFFYHFFEKVTGP